MAGGGRDTGCTHTHTLLRAGFLLGSRQTLLETLDGGKTWNPRIVEDAQEDGFNFRFNSASFSGDEGWIVGKPAILLHTTDAGATWKRVPLSNKLPGREGPLSSKLPGSGRPQGRGHKA